MKKFLVPTFALMLAALACGGGLSSPPAPIVRPIWEKNDSVDPNSILYYNGAFYALGTDHTLLAWHELSGATVWQTQADSFRLNSESNMIYVSAGGNCLALDPASGETVKSIPPDQAYLCDTGRLDDSSYNFTLTDQFNVAATRADTGEFLWETPLDLPQTDIYQNLQGRQPFLRDSRVIVSTLGFHADDQNTEYMNLQILDPETGKIIWQLIDKPFGQALLFGDKVIVSYEDALKVEPTTSAAPIPVPTGDFQLVERDLATGNEIWHVIAKHATGYFVVDNKLYECTDDGWQWFDLASGKLQSTQQDTTASAKYNCPSTQNILSNSLEVGSNVLLVEYRTTSKDNTDFENPIEDSWYTAYEISTGKTLWSTELLIHSNVGLAALGKQVILTLWDHGLRAYSLSGK